MYCKQQIISTYIIWSPCLDNWYHFDRVAVNVPLTNSSSWLHTNFSKGWNPDCENWYKIWFKFTFRVRALGAFIWNTYLACQQRPDSTNLGDDMSATSCKTGTVCVFKLCPLARWQGSAMERAVACREGHYVMYNHTRKDALESDTSIRAIFATKNLRLLFHDLCSLSHFLGQGFFTWRCLSHDIPKYNRCWIVSLSTHIENSWHIISILYSAPQYNTIQLTLQHTLQHNTTQYNSHYNTLCNTIQHNTIQYNKFYNTIQHNTTHAVTHSVTQYNTIQITLEHTLQHNTTQYNSRWNTLWNTIKHNTTHTQHTL